MTWWWLSFVDSTRPEGQQSLGVVLVQALSGDEAVRAMTARGCNPGGDEVLALRIPASVGQPPEGYANRLLGIAELQRMQALWTPDEPGVEKLGELADDGDPVARRMLGEPELH